MPAIEVDQPTYEAIDLVARVAGMQHSEVIARLVQQSRVPAAPIATRVLADSEEVAVYADYEGHRTLAMFHPLTTRVTITDGPLAGTAFKSPSSAAREVVTHYKPDVSPHRNGWTFWTLGDGSGRLLGSLRNN